MITKIKFQSNTEINSHTEIITAKVIDKVLVGNSGISSRHEYLIQWEDAKSKELKHRLIAPDSERIKMFYTN